VTTINVTVQRVAYPPATSQTEGEAWYLLICDECKAKGRMAWRPQEGEPLTLEGEWGVYQGERDFAFKSARLNVPTNPRDQLHYVCERTPGLGPTAEAALWDRLGQNWKEAQAGDIPRLRGRIYENFRLQVEALASKGLEADVVATLMGRGATQRMACLAWETWRQETLGVVQADCFRLAELPNYGFADVDRDIRHAYGIADDDPRRVRAAVLYALRRLTDGGDTVVEWTDLYQKTVGMLGGYSELVSECAVALKDEGAIVVLGASGVALKEDYWAEVEVWGFVNNNEKGGQE
jgi:exodeoxyribonuclease V alpha subunit